MIESLHIRNYVLIQSLDITFPEGLVIITGQTGSGKSILLGAIGLLLGGKADAAMIGEDGGNCVVEGTFRIHSDPVLEEAFPALDLDWNGGEIVLRRVLSASGRSRSFVNDAPVQVQALQKMASRLVDIHSQHDTLLLRDKSYQLSVLDHFAGCTEAVKSCRTVYMDLQRMKSELLSLTATLQRQTQERDYYQSQFEKLDAACLREGEMEELEAEHMQLSNAEAIRENLYAVREALEGDGEGERPGVDSILKDSARTLSRTGAYVHSCTTLSERLESVRIEVEDILAEVQDIEGSVEISPARLEEVEQRMAVLHDLMKKHSCASVGELIAARDALSETLLDTTVLEQRRTELQRSIEQKTRELEGICSRLHASRVAAVKGFGSKIQSDIRSLELDKAVFDVQLSQVSPGPTGSDEVLFRFSSTGKAPMDIQKCASGGELSRIMLCLKATMARYTEMPSMVFDEIDTGVSGSVADKMGQMICAMGEDMQVFAITHLPQVAAKGRAHYLVAKNEVDGAAVTTISRLDDEQRVGEIARMLSGSRVTPEAVSNARALLQESRQ